jgi:protein-L-isoaspartate(D-aspartate) O-methyltransferase
VAVAIDPERQLLNGAPSLLGVCIDRLELERGHHVLHVGCGLGYYSAVMAHCVGPAGGVVAIEVDADLASRARAALAHLLQVAVRTGDGSQLPDQSFEYPAFKRLRRDPHEESAGCWLHGPRFCLSA